jgi:hypothetical protein
MCYHPGCGASFQGKPLLNSHLTDAGHRRRRDAPVPAAAACAVVAPAVHHRTAEAAAAPGIGEIAALMSQMSSVQGEQLLEFNLCTVVKRPGETKVSSLDIRLERRNAPHVGRMVCSPSPIPSARMTVLRAKHSGKVMDVKYQSNDDGARIHQWKAHGGDSQHIVFQKQKNEHGWGFLRLMKSGKVMGVLDASEAEGAPVVQCSEDVVDGDASRLLFRLEPRSNGWCAVRVKHSGKVLDIRYASGDNGAWVIQWHEHGGASQLFRYECV